MAIKRNNKVFTHRLGPAIICDYSDYIFSVYKENTEGFKPLWHMTISEARELAEFINYILSNQKE